MSHHTIIMLDQILEHTKSNSIVEDSNDRLDDADNDNKNDDDDKYCPSKSIFPSSTSTLSSDRKKVQSSKTIATKNHESVVLPQRK